MHVLFLSCLVLSCLVLSCLALPCRVRTHIPQASSEPLAVGISEVAGQGHWWDTIMDDDVLAPFYETALQQVGLPPLPRVVEVVTLNPATTTGRGGLRIEQLRTPYLLRQ
jgi:hypothetical protein